MQVVAVIVCTLAALGCVVVTDEAVGRRAWRFVALGLAGIAAWIALGALAASAQAAPRCHTDGIAPFTAPDNACTPGAYQVLSRAAVCAPKDRPDLPASETRRLLGQYGVPGWTAANGEKDHRVPVFLGGLTVEDNIWPEAGPDPRRGQNPKDRLEVLVRTRVCGSATRYVPALATMRVRTAVRIFLSDWRNAYCRLIDTTPTTCRSTP